MHAISDSGATEGYRHTVITTNNGTFACNPWSESTEYSGGALCQSSGVSFSHSAPPPKAWSSLHVLNSYDSSNHSASNAGQAVDPLAEERPKLSRLEKKRIAAKRQRERKKCEITEASLQLASLEESLSELKSQNEALRLRSAVMETLVKTSDDQLRIAALVSRVKDRDGAAWHSSYTKSSSTFMCTPGFDFDLKNMSCAHLPFDEFRRLWKRVVAKGVELCKTNSCQEIVDRFTLDVMTWVENWSLVTDSGTYLTVVSVELEYGVVAEPPCNHWCDVAKSLELTSEQRKQALVGLQVVRQLMDGVRDEQRTVCSHLDEATSTCYHTQDENFVDLCGDVVLEKLSFALCRERFVCELADAFMWKNVLTCQQRLAAALNSYPFFPDAISILHGIQELSGMEPALMESPAASLSDSWSS